MCEEVVGRYFQRQHRAGTVEEFVYQAKSNEFRAQVAPNEATWARSGDVDRARGETPPALFDWPPNTSEIRRGLHHRIRREILDAV